jgi:hypothetical protein
MSKGGSTNAVSTNSNAGTGTTGSSAPSMGMMGIKMGAKRTTNTE